MTAFLRGPRRGGTERNEVRARWPPHSLKHVRGVSRGRLSRFRAAAYVAVSLPRLLQAHQAKVREQQLRSAAAAHADRRRSERLRKELHNELAVKEAFLQVREQYKASNTSPMYACVNPAQACQREKDYLLAIKRVNRPQASPAVIGGHGSDGRWTDRTQQRRIAARAARAAFKARRAEDVAGAERRVMDLLARAAAGDEEAFERAVAHEPAALARVLREQIKALAQGGEDVMMMGRIN